MEILKRVHCGFEVRSQWNQKSRKKKRGRDEFFSKNLLLQSMNEKLSR
jgi:hypothetical protein